MIDDCDSDEREGFFSNENSGGGHANKSPTNAGILKTKNSKSKSLPYPSLGIGTTGPPAATESTDDDCLDEK